MIEALEQRLQVVRTGAGLRMTLEAESRPVLQRDSLQRAVEQRAMRGPDILRQRGLIDGEPVVLAGDEDPPGFQILHGMVRAVMAELHLHGASTHGQAQDLMPQADAEQRQVGLEQLAGRGYGVVTGFRITWTV